MSSTDAAKLAYLQDRYDLQTLVGHAAHPSVLSASDIGLPLAPAGNAALVPVNTRWKGAEAASILAAARVKALCATIGFLDTDTVAMLDGRLTATLQPEDLRVGDVVEVLTRDGQKHKGKVRGLQAYGHKVVPSGDSPGSTSSLVSGSARLSRPQDLALLGDELGERVEAFLHCVREHLAAGERAAPRAAERLTVRPTRTRRVRQRVPRWECPRPRRSRASSRRRSRGSAA